LGARAEGVPGPVPGGRAGALGAYHEVLPFHDSGRVRHWGAASGSPDPRRRSPDQLGPLQARHSQCGDGAARFQHPRQCRATAQLGGNRQPVPNPRPRHVSGWLTTRGFHPRRDRASMGSVVPAGLFHCEGLPSRVPLSRRPAVALVARSRHRSELLCSRAEARGGRDTTCVMARCLLRGPRYHVGVHRDRIQSAMSRLP